MNTSNYFNPVKKLINYLIVFAIYYPPINPIKKILHQMFLKKQIY